MDRRQVRGVDGGGHWGGRGGGVGCVRERAGWAVVGGRGEEELVGYARQTTACLQCQSRAILVTVHGHHGVVDRDGWSCKERKGRGGGERERERERERGGGGVSHTSTQKKIIWQVNMH